mmetsp:Transcript_24573/g.64724  ORF Transcript_24573/g.64724 Transcript_24573/m.64724 type:complete len:103 (-) Transcript_24573:32-340(-)
MRPEGLQGRSTLDLELCCRAAVAELGPCDATISWFRDIILNLVHMELPASQKRKIAYAAWVRERHGPLRRGERVMVPVCVKGFIRVVFSETAGGSYQGHHDE